MLFSSESCWSGRSHVIPIMVRRIHIMAVQNSQKDTKEGQNGRIIYKTIFLYLAKTVISVACHKCHFQHAVFSDSLRQYTCNTVDTTSSVFL